MAIVYNSKFYREGFFNCLNNSESLIKIARYSAKNGEFGIGNSLAILSAEEGIKGFLCMARLMNSEYEIDNFEDLFKNHKIKHEHIKTTIAKLELFQTYLLQPHFVQMQF